jgi:hypothetical protein
LTSQFLVIKTQHNPIFGGRYRVPNSEPPPWCQETHSPHFDAPAPLPLWAASHPNTRAAKNGCRWGKKS